ncbi:MAG: PAS domain S-box protein [Deltaproteobacteria bacterium]|nr:PAS domain S-box protein [Deltaproteobacteria bacterium]
MLKKYRGVTKMRIEQVNVFEERIKKLKAENISFREALCSLKSENENLRRFIGDSEHIFHSDPAGIMVYQKDKIVNINRTMLDRLGYDQDEIAGMSFPDFFHPDDASVTKDLHKKIRTGKITSAQHEIKLLNHEGMPVICELWVNKIRLRNRNAYLLNFIFIEKLKEVERKHFLRKKRDALMIMASGLSRELHRCLDDVERNIYEMESFSANNENIFIKNIDDIKYASKKVSFLTRQLGVLSGETHDEKRWTYLDVNRIVKDAVSEASLYWIDKTGKSIEDIVLKMYLRSVSMIKGDPAAIRTALVNIVVNAIEAVPGGGEILVTTEDNAGSTCIYVQDGGTGITEGIKDDIFDPFFTTKGIDSFGLGLSLCKTIIEGHGGKIEITSNENQGCTVEIELPQVKKQKKNSAAVVNKKISRSRVLIIQDEDFLREILSQMFSSKGLSVDKADNGWEGLGKLKKRRAALVLADSAILEMNTASFVERCRRINSEIRIVITNAHKEGVQPGIIDHPAADLTIAKPVDVNRTVKDVLNLII